MSLKAHQNKAQVYFDFLLYCSNYKYNFMKLHYFLFLFAIAIMLGCGKDDSDDNPQPTLLTGKVRGVPFTYGSGRFVDFGPQSDEFNVRIDNAGPTVLDSCDTADDVYVRVDFLKETGKRVLSEANDIYVVFFHPDISQALIVYGEGYYDVISFTENEMVLEFDIDRDDNNYLKGRCTVYKCN